MDEVEIFSDGACKGNPGPGGWGALMRVKTADGVRTKELYGGEHNTTNNRMELLAVIKALEALKRSCSVIIHTDSVYVQKGMTEWIRGWKQRGWKTASREPVKNVDLWQRLDELAVGHQIQWRWVKGHAGHVENEMADRLANKGVEALLNKNWATLSANQGDNLQ